jgi:hypothetical protein
VASNLSTIGFVFSNENAFQEMMVRLASDLALEAPCPAGRYGIWRSRTGAELWFHLCPSGDGVEIAGLTPFFEGESDIALRVTRRIHRDGDNAFEGAVQGWINPSDDGSEGSYPLVFEAVDYALLPEDLEPVVRRVRLAAFAQELRAYEDEAAYFTAHRGPAAEGQLNLAAQAFIPMGLFAGQPLDDGDVERPAESAVTAACLFTGKILDVRDLRNEETDTAFIWLLVETLDMTIDVVCDPDVVEGKISEGGIVEIAGLLFGRFLD